MFSALVSVHKLFQSNGTYFRTWTSSIEKKKGPCFADDTPKSIKKSNLFQIHLRQAPLSHPRFRGTPVARY